MTTKMRKLMSQLRKELTALPDKYNNAPAIEQEMEASIARIREIRATDGVLLPAAFLERFEVVLNETPEGLRDQKWHGAMDAIRETLKKS